MLTKCLGILPCTRDVAWQRSSRYSTRMQEAARRHVHHSQGEHSSRYHSALLGETPAHTVNKRYEWRHTIYTHPLPYLCELGCRHNTCLQQIQQHSTRPDARQLVHISDEHDTNWMLRAEAIRRLLGAIAGQADSLKSVQRRRNKVKRKHSKEHAGRSVVPEEVPRQAEHPAWMPHPPTVL